MRNPSVSLSLMAGMRKGGKLQDLIRSGERVEKQGGGGSRGRLDGYEWEVRSSNCGSHGGGLSKEDNSEL